MIFEAIALFDILLSPMNIEWTEINDFKKLVFFTIKKKIYNNLTQNKIFVFYKQIQLY
jgi:hypothetical protein